MLGQTPLDFCFLPVLKPLDELQPKRFLINISLCDHKKVSGFFFHPATKKSYQDSKTIELRVFFHFFFFFKPQSIFIIVEEIDSFPTRSTYFLG